MGLDKGTSLNETRGGNNNEAPQNTRANLDHGENNTMGPDMGRNNTNRSLGTIGLTDPAGMFISSYSSSEALEKFSEGVVNGLKDARIKVDAYKIDKDKYNLGFSATLFAAVMEDGNVYYHIAILGSTGREPVHVHHIVEDFDKSNTYSFLVTADALDDTTFDVAEAILTKANPGKTLIPLEGSVVANTADLLTTGETLAKLVHDLFIARYYIKAGLIADLSIDGLIDQLYVNDKQIGFISLDVSLIAGATQGKLGGISRADLSVESSIAYKRSIRSFHDTEGRKAIATVTGYLEYIMGDETNQYTNETRRVAQPMIILNEFVSRAPTLSYALLSIINATTFTNRSTLHGLIVEKDAGPLNYLFNYGGDGDKFGTKESFKDPGAVPEAINAIIRTHIKPDPIFAIEIEVNGPDYGYLSAFAALNDPDRAAKATSDILLAADALLGVPMQTGVVAANEGMIIPLGTYIDNDGEIRDIREIDTVFITKHSTDTNLLWDWIYSNAPTDTCIDITGKDPYTLKLECINRIANILNIDPVITGKAVRIPLHDEFVNELVKGAMEIGYKPKAESPNIGYVDNNNLQSVAAAYNHASVGSLGLGVQRAAGFQNQAYAGTRMYR